MGTLALCLSPYADDDDRFVRTDVRFYVRYLELYTSAIPAADLGANTLSPEVVQSLGLDYDFYLAYALKKYDPDWRLYFQRASMNSLRSK
jgi:hypothetical protein